MYFRLTDGTLLLFPRRVRPGFGGVVDSEWEEFHKKQAAAAPVAVQ